ncbi:MAG: pilus assembly protein PilM [Candidatus Omnitrophica bacterium]|nr:pilus assembly protein PilM [Candidatus Omnitrophota bacterium]MDD5611246.1 pilus assembly protein PilM [Candidatus Omnitrophota bacterium]
MKLNLGNILSIKSEKLVSIDFGQLFIKIAYVLKSQKECKLLAYDLKKIALTEENTPQITAFIREFLKRNSIFGINAYLTISDPNCIVIKNIVLPVLPKNEVLKAIQWQIKDELGIGCEESLVEWRVVKEYTDEDGANKQEVVFACLRNIERYLSMCRQCGLLPLGLTSTCFNYANILREAGGQAAVRAILDIGSDDSMLCIYIQNKLAFTRRLAFSTEKMTQSLMDTLLTAQGPLKLSYERAEEIRDTFGIPQSDSGTLEEGLPAMHVISLMRPLLELLVRELKSSVDYFTSTYKEAKPGILYLTGGGANLKNLDIYLNKEIGVNVSSLPFPPNINIKNIQAEGLDKDKNQLVNALGAALSDPDSVAFLPPEAKIQRIEPVAKRFLGLATVAIVSFLVISYYLLNLRIGYYKKKLNSNLSILEKNAEIKAGIEKLSPLEDMLYEIKRQKVPATGILKLLSRVLPANLTLDELVLDQKNNILVLKGQAALDKNKKAQGSAQAVLSLNKSSFFKKATVISSKIQGDNEIFEVDCELVY